MMPNKMSYTSRKQVKIQKPKPNKFSYSSSKQVKISKPIRHESLSEMARAVLFETQIDKLTVINPKTKKRIKVLSALGYAKDHPAYLAAIALLKKRKITVPGNVHSVKPGEQIPMFGGQYEPNKTAGYTFDVLERDDAEKYLIQKYKAIKNKEYAHVQAALDTYTGSGYSWINSALRGSGDAELDELYNEVSGYLEKKEDEDDDVFSERLQEEVERRISEDVDAMQNAFDIDGLELETPVIVYRGIKYHSGIVNEIIDGGVGTIVQDDGFVSTSLDEKKAIDFTGNYSIEGESSGALLKITVSKGTKAIYPRAVGSGISAEKELILDSGTKFKITSINQSGKLYIINAETVSELR